MKWRPLLAILLGLLMVGGMVFAGALQNNRGGIFEPPSKGQPPISPTPGKEVIMKTFVGKSSMHMAEQFLQKYWDKLTLRINLEEFGDCTFIGIALRPLPGGMYAPLYYFANESSGYASLRILNESFTSEATKFVGLPLRVKGALGDEPRREWDSIGRISTITTSRDITTWRGDKVTVYNKLGVDFWVTEAKMGYYYYVYLSHEAKVPSERNSPKDFRVAVKEVRERATILNPSREQAYFGIGSFKPEGSGSSSEPTVTWGLNVGIDTTGLPNAGAGFSETYTKGLTFKWYTDDIDANRDIEFEFYGLNKKEWLGSSPAWGQIFITHPVVVPFVKKGTPFHMIEIKLRAEADFVYEETRPYCGLGCGTYTVKKSTSAPPIEFTVELYPWFVNRK
ncbi:hypothetical protein [Thermococcus aciditolerans]|uniref:Uncharacterized protein n=1 Tax=Thermococcus aciditolerans TaxID=2598455 RepID=A0A5C0SJM8_9EURY|nr:hypothetical protein [Thermococcus aciditolerans]QEK14705.1 hypothetical protein FPV09_05910 [Thermococcus aciditolerans]